MLFEYFPEKFFHHFPYFIARSAGIQGGNESLPSVFFAMFDSFPRLGVVDTEEFKIMIIRV